MTEQPEIEIDDAIVLLLGTPTFRDVSPGRLEGITRLEKLIFLLERETRAKRWLSESADFRAYNFGPFSAKVYQAADMLSAAGLLHDSRSRQASTEESWEQRNVIDPDTHETNVSDPYEARTFQLTERGWRYYQALVESLRPDDLTELSSFKEKFARLPLRQLVRYVYQRYDDFTHESLIRDEVLGRER